MAKELADQEPVTEAEKLTAEKVASIMKESMPILVKEVGQQVAEDLKDQWEGSLEKTAKAQEKEDREARKSLNAPLDVQKAVADARTQVQREAEKSGEGDFNVMSELMKAMLATKSSDPDVVMNKIKSSYESSRDPKQGPEKKAIVEEIEKSYDRQRDQTKSMQASQFDNAGILIPEPVSDEIIPLLESMTFVRRRAGGAISLDRGTLKVGKQNQRATAFHLDEAEDYRPSEAKFSDLKLDAKKLTAMQVATREMIQYGGDVAARIISTDLATALAQKEDETLLRSEGTEKRPRGLRHWISDDQIFTDPVDDFENNIQNILATLVRQVKTLLNQKLPVTTQNSTFGINPDIWASMFRAHDAGSGISPFRAEMREGRILGYEFDVSTNVPNALDRGGVPTSEMYFVYWPAVLMGAVPGVRLEVSTEGSYIGADGQMKSAYSRDEAIWKAVQYYDMVLRYDFAGTVQEVPSDWTALGADNP